MKWSVLTGLLLYSKLWQIRVQTQIRRSLLHSIWKFPLDLLFSWILILNINTSIVSFSWMRLVPRGIWDWQPHYFFNIVYLITQDLLSNFYYNFLFGDFMTRYWICYNIINNTCWILVSKPVVQVSPLHKISSLKIFRKRMFVLVWG